MDKNISSSSLMAKEARLERKQDLIQKRQRINRRIAVSKENLVTEKQDFASSHGVKRTKLSPSLMPTPPIQDKQVSSRKKLESPSVSNSPLSQRVSLYDLTNVYNQPLIRNPEIHGSPNNFSSSLPSLNTPVIQDNIASTRLIRPFVSGTSDFLPTDYSQPSAVQHERSFNLSSHCLDVIETSNCSKNCKQLFIKNSVISSIKWDGSNESIQDGRVHYQPSSNIEGFNPISFENQSQFHEDDAINSLFEESERQGCLDFGDCKYQCRFCGASVWYEERAEKKRNTFDPEFSICCMKGKVQLPLLKKPLKLLFDLMNGIDKRSCHFLQNIRQYNSMFAFTSIGGKVDTSLNDGSAAPQFILSGQNFHRIGSLLPIQGQKPKFAQLYIYDTENEISNRVNPFRATEMSQNVDSSLVQDLKDMVDNHNVLAQSFRRVRDLFKQDEMTFVCLKLFRSRCRDARTYNLPTADEVATVVVGDFDSSDIGRDVVVKKNDGQLQRIHETHTCFLPLQYPLLFPYGEDGYQEDIPIRQSILATNQFKRVRVTLREFIAYRIQDRTAEHGNILFARRLFQQFLVDAYTMIEAQRLQYINLNQSTIRSDILNGLEEAVTRGETDPTSCGKRIILPKSFTGGMRYMFNNCQDAMAICKRFGYPDLFITVTCNPQWQEIKQFVDKRHLTAEDRPDISCRVFQMKLQQIISDFKKRCIFGKVIAGMYTIEFQKRGLPHAHILLWLHPDDKLTSVDMIDKVISSELPDKSKYPRLFDTITSFMIHGPCGAANPNSPCMKNGSCTKFFPKKFVNKTSFDEDGYPVYKRRDKGISTYKKGVKLDNRFVVPYNPKLLMKYQAHINLEYCNKSNSIKYLFKYVNKGPDRVTVSFSSNSSNSNGNQKVDEIKQYYDCRYLSPCESVWRILAFDIHHRWPPVQRLTFHLPNHQLIIFKDHENIDDVVLRSKEKRTMFEAWMDANKLYPEAKDLTYAEFPTNFVFNQQKHQWSIRKQGQSIGRLQYVPPGTGELYYMRLLLTVQKGCTSYESIRTVDNITYNSFQQACHALGLLTDDKEFIDGIKEVAELASGIYIRKLFVTLLVSNTMSRPDYVWENTWTYLADGIEYDRRRLLKNPDLHIPDSDLKNLCLIEIDKLLHSNGNSLKNFHSMPLPENYPIHQYQNHFLVDELSYNKEEMATNLNNYLSSINDEQRSIFNEIMDSVKNNKVGFYFVYGYGGTGKTFVWKTLSAALRAEGKIVLNVASSGIASLLLPGGRTTHSKFSIPLELTELSTCNIKQGSLKAELLQQTSLIIWDEACMVNKYAFEALDKTLRDIMRFSSNSASEKPFGGKVVVLGGDFRQILPVIPRASREDIVFATINSSKLWSHCKVLNLTKNMRLQTGTSSSIDPKLQEFADWIINLGDGNLGLENDGEADIEIPEDLLIMDFNNPLDHIVQFVYPNILDNMSNFAFFEERAILAPTLEVVKMINEYILSKIPGEEKEYLSSDSYCIADEDVGVEPEWLTTEFLNEIKCSGIPNHKLLLKKGVPIMLLRNIDQASGLCNGTRLMVDELGNNVISTIVVTGNHIGEKIFIPRMNLIPSDPGMPIKFQRRQFPISICFAMSINKSQGQSLSYVGLFLSKPVFTHGQLYVAISRVKSRNGLKILILDENGNPCNTTKNVVFKEVFQKVYFLS